MTIRPYSSLIDPPSPQNSFLSEEVSSSAIKTPLSQSVKSLKTEQVASDILATTQNKNIHLNQIIEPLSNESNTAKMLLIKAIDLNPKDYKAYYKLTKSLKDNETVKLLSGEFYTKKELFLKAIDLDPTHVKYYYYLAALIEKNKGILFLDGNFYRKEDLYLKVIELDPKHVGSYYNLAELLNEDETIKLNNNESYTKKELYLKVIELEPKDANPYYNLAELMDEDETIQLLNGELYTKKKFYIKVIDLDPQHPEPCCCLANLLDENETVQLLNGELYTQEELFNKVIDLYVKAIDRDPKYMISYYNLALFLEENETVQLLNGELYTQKKLFLKAMDLSSNKMITHTIRKYLKEIYIQEIEKNPKSIESYFGLIAVMEEDFTPFQQRSDITINDDTISIKTLIEKAFDLDPDLVCSPRFAPAFFCAAVLLHKKSMSLLDDLNYLEENITPKDLAHTEMLLKQGTSLTLNNNKILSTTEIYQQALPFLSSTYLRDRGDEGVGNYLSHRKSILLQDGVKFTKLMAYIYAYQERDQYADQEEKLNDLLIKIGDALHPEQRITLNDELYDKRSCYKEAYESEYVDMGELFLSLAESLYPHEHIRKKNLFSNALEKASFYFKNHWRAHITLARILSQYELKKLGSEYLLMFGKCLENYKNPNCNLANKSIEDYYKSLNNKHNTILDDTIYFAKKHEFLLNLLTFLPSCEEAYVALATSFDNPLIIHKKSYPSKESLYLKAIDINPEYSFPYFLLGKELFNKKIENIQLLNGITLSCKQLLMRAIQLGTYQAEAYHLAALVMDDREGILLFDGETTLSRGDLFIRAFELDFTRAIDLKNFIYYVRRNKKNLVNMSS